MRNPRSSLYRSTSSLCDNNSVSSNASSAMSSPFYNGQTTFGGASATSRRTNAAFNQDPLHHHRPKIPTNLVTSRSTSSLNSIAGSTSMSTTAKRILDVMSKYNTPLTEVRRISNALPSIAETSALSKRKSILELDATTNDIDKTKRSLMKPNTPYNRPFGRNPVESVLTNELHVPSMPELLQLKKFATNTMKIRDIASNSDSVLNKPAPAPALASAQVNQYKLSKQTLKATDGDLDTSNNNKSVSNKNNTAITNNITNDTTKKNKYKIQSNLNKRNLGKGTGADLMPEPLNLPNISLMMDKKAEIKFSEQFKLQNSEQKTSGGTPDNGLQIPFKVKSSNTNASTTPVTKQKPTNGNDCDLSKKFEISPSKASTLSTQPTTFTYNVRLEHTVDSPLKPLSTKLNCSKASPNFRFTEPIVIKTASNALESQQYNNFGQKHDYKFSEPTFLTDKPAETKTEANKSLSNFKFESKPINKITSDSGIAETTNSFDSIANKSSGSLASKVSVATTKDNGFSAGKTVSSFSTQLQDDDTFKSFGAKTAATPKPVIDDVFKSIVNKQKSNWECTACCTQNDVSKLKCVCCEQPKSGAPAEAPKPAATPKPVVDDIFKSIVNKQKSNWECSACMAQNDASKSKCVCCEQSRDVTAGATSSDSVPAKPQFSFGNSSAMAAPKSTFSFGSNPSATTTAANAAAPVASGFSFGNLPAKTTNPPAQFAFGNLKSNESTPATSNDNDKAKESVQKPAPSSTQFSFGSPTVLPSKKPVESVGFTEKPVDPIATDDIFKSIVDKQKKASWECDSCMTSNPNSVEKCACCAEPKPGSAPSKDIEKKDSGLAPSSKFSFGSQSSTSFSFGSKPENKPSFQFGNFSGSSSTTETTTAAASTSTAKITFAAPAPVTAPAPTTVKTDAVTSTVPAIFGGSSQTPSFSFAAPKPDSSATAPVGQTPLSGFKFTFGSAKAPTFGSNEISKDVTDTGPSSNTANKEVAVLENVLIKPATNGPNEAPKPMFSFGQPSVVKSDDDQPSQAKKRPNTDHTESNILAKAPATGASPSFIFGQPQSVNNTFSAMGSSPAANTSQDSSTAQATQKPTFAFGANKPAIASTFPTVQPSFSSTPFSFNASSPAATTTASSTFGAPAAAAPALGTPSQPIFGSSTFSSNAPALPALGGFKAGTAFGSSMPAFGASSPNTEVSIS